MTNRLSAAIGVLFLTFATATPVLAQEAGAGFRPTGAEFARAYNAGDAEALAAMYADDAVLMPPDKPAVSGHAAILAFAREDTAGAKQAGLKLEIDAGASGSSGNLGWHSGAFRLKAADGNTAATGKYVEVWERRAGKWVMIRDAWNMDAPMAPATPPAAQPTPAPAPTAEPPVEAGTEKK